LLSYQLTVLRYVMVTGFATATGFGLLGLINLVLKMLHPESVPVRGWTSIFVMVSFFGGLTVFLLGLILERLATTLTRAQGRPAFFIVDRSRDVLFDSVEEEKETPERISA
jgi:hypothetical protein